MKQYLKNIINRLFRWFGFEPTKSEIKENQLTVSPPEDINIIERIIYLNKMLDENYPLASYKFDVRESAEAYNNAKAFESKFRAYRGGIPQEMKELAAKDEIKTKEYLNGQEDFLRRKEKNKRTGNKIRWNAHLKEQPFRAASNKSDNLTTIEGDIINLRDNVFGMKNNQSEQDKKRIQRIQDMLSVAENRSGVTTPIKSQSSDGSDRLKSMLSGAKELLNKENIPEAPKSMTREMRGESKSIEEVKNHLKG